MFSISSANNKLIGIGVKGYSEMGINYPITEIEVSEEVYNDYAINPDKYMYSEGKAVVNPNYADIEEEKRKAQFYGDFFKTSLGYIRRKVSMKTGETKDFLTDLLPVISMAVSQQQAVNIITYKEPDFTHDITDWEELQEIKVATPQFIQECFNQVSTDFSGVE